jgi:hypothetical protein
MMNGPNRKALYDWIEQNRPELHQKLYSLPLPEVLPILNEATGLAFSLGDDVENCCGIFLQKFKRLHELH